MAAAAQKIVPLKPSQDETEFSPLPHFAVVGPYEYSIREIDDVERLKSGYMGFCNEGDLEIGIGLGTAPAHQAETMIHEILHAILSAQSLSEPNIVADEEALITGLTKGIMQVVRDNPQILSWIAERYPVQRP